MTVKELKEQLALYDDNADVVFYGFDEEHAVSIREQDSDIANACALFYRPETKRLTIALTKEFGD